MTINFMDMLYASIPFVVISGITIASATIVYSDHKNKKTEKREEELSKLREEFNTAHMSANNALINELANTLIVNLNKTEPWFGPQQHADVSFAHEKNGKTPFLVSHKSVSEITFRDAGIVVTRTATADNVTIMVTLLSRYHVTVSIFHDPQMLEKWHSVEKALVNKKLPENIGDLLDGFSLKHAKQIMVTSNDFDALLNKENSTSTVLDEVELLYSLAASLSAR